MTVRKRLPPRKATHIFPATYRYRTAAWNSKTGQLWIHLNDAWIAYPEHKVCPFNNDPERKPIVGKFTLRGSVQWLS